MILIVLAKIRKHHLMMNYLHIGLLSCIRKKVQEINGPSHSKVYFQVMPVSIAGSVCIGWMWPIADL